VGPGAATARRAERELVAVAGLAGKLTAIGLTVTARHALHARHAQAVLATTMAPRRVRWTVIARLPEIAGAVTVVRNGKGRLRTAPAPQRLPRRVTNLPADVGKGRANAEALHSGW
jgi:hypothetical protein